MTKKESKDTVDEASVNLAKAKLALEKDKMVRVTLCKQKIDDALKECGCALIPTIVLSQGRQQERIDIVAIDPS